MPIKKLPVVIFARLKTLSVYGDNVPAQDLPAITNNAPIYLMGQNFFGINESIRLRGWNSWRLGDKLLYGTIEPRIGTQQLVLASFIDFGNAWDKNNNINDILYTMGFEIRLNLGLVIISYGAAQDFNRWKNNSIPFNYLQLALVNPF